jgi:acyl carrier protein
VTADELREIVLRALGDVAPDADLSTLAYGEAYGEDLRRQLDIDSMDHLNFVIALSEATRVEIPERDYPKLVTVDGAVSYLASRTGATERK